MASRSVAEFSTHLLLPSPSFSCHSHNPGSHNSTVRLRNGPSSSSRSPRNATAPNRRSDSSNCPSRSLIRRSGSLCITTACYSASPAPSEIARNGAAKDTGAALTPSPLSVVANQQNEAQSKSESGEGVPDRFDLPELTESYFTLETLEEQANSLDPELQGILSNVADVQRQNERLGERMRDIQELLGRTTRSLNAKAQQTKIEAAKLKKLAKLHQVEEIPRAEDVRRKVYEARMRLERNDRIISGKMRDFSGTVEETVAAKDALALSDGGLGSLLQPEHDRRATVDEINSERDSEQSSLLLKGTGKEDIVGPDAVTSELQEFIVAHPGALSCTRTTITSEPSRKSAAVVMKTTVRCDGDPSLFTTLDQEDYVALAIQTLAETADELKKSRFQRSTEGDPVRLKKHARSLDFLANGRVVKAKPMEPPSKFGHESFAVQLLNKQSGEKIDAMFKPGSEGSADEWHRAPIEAVAYKLNLMLGMDYVPPVVYRSGGVDVDYKHYASGAFIYFVPNAKLLRKIPGTNWGVSVALLLSDTRILDVLLNNSDRHHGHFLFGEHWADGKMRPVLCDHAAGFRKEAVVKMEHENAFQTGAVRCVSAKTYLRLRFLDKQTAMSAFEGLLSAGEVNELMQRRDTILSYLDNLVQERGYNRTVIEA